MRKFAAPVIFVLVTALFPAASARADTIKLKNGHVFEGVITTEEEGRVQIKTGSGVQIWLPREQILLMEKEATQEDPKVNEPAQKPDMNGLDEDAIRARELLRKMREQPDKPSEKGTETTSTQAGLRRESIISALTKGPENAPVTVTVFSDYL